MTEALGEALFVLSDRLRADGFLDRKDHHAVYERVVAAFNSPTPADAGEVREKVARIIAPKAWERRQAHLDRQEGWRSNHPDEGVAMSMREAGLIIADEVVASSLAKADQILTLLSPTILVEDVGESGIKDRWRLRGQEEGFAAAVQWLRDRSAMKPNPPLAEAANVLADQMEQSRIPASVIRALASGEG